MMTRRDLLKLSVASLFAAPLLPYAGMAPARAADGTAPKRLLIVFSPNGTIPHRQGITGTDVMSFARGSIYEPLEVVKDQMIFIDGMDFSTGDNHEGGMRSMLTAGGPTSLDQLLGDHIGQGSRFPSLILGALTSIWGGTVQTRVSYRGGETVTPDDSPLHAFQRLFGDVGNTSLLARRGSVLDVARSELNELRGRLDASRKAQLDTHLDSLRTLERGLQGGGTCEMPVAPDDYRPNDNDAFPHIADAQLELAVQALACGATNVCTVQLSHSVSPVVFTWLGQTQGHHDLSHAGDSDTVGVQNFVDCERWVAGRVAGVIQRLRDTPDPEGGSLLDSTLVLWPKELGDSRLHVCRSVPWILAGGGETFRLGRRVDLAGGTHDSVLAAIANRFGMGLDSFGTGSARPTEVL